MLERSLHLTCFDAPHDDRAVCGAAEQEAAAGAEAAAVDPVAVTPERRKGKLREVGRGINTERFITGGGRQEGWREGTAGDLICMMSESAI